MIYKHFEEKSAIVTVDQQDENSVSIIIRKQDGTLLVNTAISAKNTTVNIMGKWDVIG